MKMELQKYDAPAAAARKSVTEQARILQAIGAAHAEFIRLKPPQNEVDRFVQQFFNRCTSVRPIICAGPHVESERCICLVGD